ncbi:MAG: NAD(P)H-dependent oxidoreductase subunit E [Gracilibacteraceae bacterium]|jgi:NADH-quinone oxidoreductase subunit E|nr:NAD(P)H-dependent oxidoreductase subunit E [Gracilibacteraceae bacterium]
MILKEDKLSKLLQKYPQERRHTLAVFQDIQHECGYLPKEHIIEAARYLKTPLAQAYAMVTFYRSFSLLPRGKYVIRVCDGTACHIKNVQGRLDCLKRVLGLDPGETDKDGLFTVETVSCLGACAISPVMQINEEYYGNLTEEKIYEILADLYRKEMRKL